MCFYVVINLQINIPRTHCIVTVPTSQPYCSCKGRRVFLNSRVYHIHITPIRHQKHRFPCLQATTPFLLLRFPLPLHTSCPGTRRSSSFLRLVLRFTPPLGSFHLIQLLLQYIFERFVSSREEHDIIGIDYFAARMFGEDFEVAGGVC